jgi:hypothetical protein
VAFLTCAAILAGAAAAGAATEVPAGPLATGDVHDPVLVDEAGTLHLVWWDGQRPGGDVRASHRPPDGTWSETITLSDGFETVARPPFAIVDPRGRVCTFWYGWLAGQFASQGLYRRCMAEGSWSAAELVDQREPFARFTPMIGPDGIARAVRVVAPSTIALGDAPVPTLGHPVVDAASIAIDTSGRVLVAWQDLGDPAQPNLSVQAVTAASVTGGFSPPAPIDEGREAGGLPSLLSANGAIHAWWSGTSEIFYRRWDGAFGPLEAVPAPGIVDPRPTLAVDAAGLPHLAFIANDGVYVTARSASGTWARPTLVPGSGLGAEHAAIAVTANNASVVVWSLAGSPGALSSGVIPATAGPGPTNAAGGGRSEPRPFAASVPDPAEITLDPVIVAETALLAAATVLLVPFPAALFNETLDEHYAEITGWFGRWRRRVRGIHVPGRFWESGPGIVVFLVTSALVLGFLDPTFGPNARSAATILGLLVGLAVVTAVFEGPAAVLRRREGDRGVLRALPATIVITIACVAISRLAAFQPGYAYGLLLGFVFSGRLGQREEGRIEAGTGITALAVSAAAWLALAAVRAADTSGSTALPAVALETALTTVVVAGIEGLLFAMLPVRPLPGAKVFAWSRRAWAILFGAGMFAFLHVLLNPSSGYLSDSSRVPLATTVGLLLLFAGASVGLWAYFEIRGRLQARSRR